MSQFVPESGTRPTVTAVIAERRPAAVTAASLVMLVLAVAGAGAVLVGLVQLWLSVTRFSMYAVVLRQDPEFQPTLQMFVLCVVVGVLAAGVWRGGSGARLAAFAALGAAVVVTSARAAGHLVAVVRGLNDPYDEDWQQTLVVMWAYLFVTAVFAIPIPLLNRPAVTKWFRDRRAARSGPIAVDQVRRPGVLTLVVTALVVLAALTVASTGWHIGAVVTGGHADPGDVPEVVIGTLAGAVIPLLILTAAIIETGAGSRLGQTAASMAGGYACYLGLERLPLLVGGSWLRDWQQFGELFTTMAIGAVGAVTLVLLLRPRVVDYLAYQSVDLEPDYLLAAEAEEEDGDED